MCVSLTSYKGHGGVYTRLHPHTPRCQVIRDHIHDVPRATGAVRGEIGGFGEETSTGRGSGSADGVANVAAAGGAAGGGGGGSGTNGTPGRTSTSTDTGSSSGTGSSCGTSSSSGTSTGSSGGGGGDVPLHDHGPTHTPVVHPLQTHPEAIVRGTRCGPSTRARSRARARARSRAKAGGERDVVLCKSCISGLSINRTL